MKTSLIVGLSVLTLSGALTAHDEPPASHRKLRDAASWAIVTGNIELLEALLQAGYQINQPLKPESETTALAHAAGYNDLRVVRFLIENGANPSLTDKHGDRPIDRAFRHGYTDVCEILRKPSEQEDMLAGYPEPMLKAAFVRGSGTSKRLRFVSLNGEDPPEELLKFFKRYWPGVRARSRAEQIDKTGNPEAETAYRDSKTGEFGEIVELKLTKVDDDHFTWYHRFATGPALSGGGAKGDVIKRYGYWFTRDVVGWDE